MRPCIVCGEPENPGLLTDTEIPRCDRHRRRTQLLTCSSCGEERYLRSDKIKSRKTDSCNQCRHLKTTKPKTGFNPVEQSPPLFEYIKEHEFNLDDWLSHSNHFSNLKKKREIGQESADIEIKTDEPIAITYSADWHLGSSIVDYRQFTDNLRYFLNTPGLYMATVGDLIDNFSRFKNIMAVMNQVMNKEEQEDLLSAILDKLIESKKLLCVVCGNHEWRDETIIGSSFIKRLMAEKERVPYMEAKGILNLKIGKISYTNLLAHKSRFNSYLHPLHSAKRLYELEYPADVVVTAHTHNPGFEVSWRHGMAADQGTGIGGPVIFIRTGTYKIGDDTFATRNYSKGRLANPTVVYNSHHKEMTPFMNAESAVNYMRIIKDAKT